MTSRILMSVFIAATLLGCSDEPLPTGDVEQASLDGPDPCTTAPPDVYTDVADWVPFGRLWTPPLPPIVVDSQSGFYAYPYRGRTCLGFIADFEFHPHSNADPNSQAALNIAARPGPWDLPSSGADHVAPTTQVDMQREAMTFKFYRKAAGETSFSLFASYTYLNGVGTGNQPGPDGWYLPKPLVGEPNLIYRVVVTVKLRTSYQQARVVLDDIPPS